jgi:hypothetical protein
MLIDYSQWETSSLLIYNSSISLHQSDRCHYTVATQLAAEGSADDLHGSPLYSACMIAHVICRSTDSLPFPTQMSTLDTLCASMPLEDFPAIFRDALLINRDLELTLIWSDALRIIQDSSEGRGWLVESTRMDRVYKKSSYSHCRYSFF